MWKLLISIVLVSIAQTFVFTLFHDIAVDIYQRHYFAGRPNLNWGISVKISVTLFIVLALINGFICKLRNRGRVKWLFPLLFSLIFAAIWIKDFSITPFKTLLLVISALIGLYSFFPISKIVDYLFAKVSNQF